MSHQRNGDYKTPKDEWGTPDPLFQQLNREFNFTVDIAATVENRKCPAFFDNFLN